MSTNVQLFNIKNIDDLLRYCKVVYIVDSTGKEMFTKTQMYNINSPQDLIRIAGVTVSVDQNGNIQNPF